MNRFQIMPCIDRSEISGGEPGELVLPLASEIKNNCILFFPISDDVGSIINHLLESEETAPQQLHMIDVFKTMISTWNSGERFLSGILIDMQYNAETNEDIINVNLILSDANGGYIEAVIKVNFAHAIIIAVLEDIDIMISDDVLSRLLPDTFEDDEDNDDDDDDSNDKDIFPVDENILKIAKQIMDGKIK